MTVKQLEHSMSARELDEWVEYHRMKAEKREEALREAERKAKSRR